MADNLRSHIWRDPAALERLLALHAKGLAASEIARDMNVAFGANLTRNAIIGKLHRLGVCGPRQVRNVVRLRKPAAPRKLSREPITPETRRLQNRINAKLLGAEPVTPRKPNGRPKPVLVPFNAEAVARPFIDLGPRQCRWPLDMSNAETTALSLFCAQPRAEGGGSYCLYHGKRAFAAAPSPAAKRKQLLRCA